MYDWKNIQYQISILQSFAQYGYFNTAYPLFRPCNHLANLSTTDSMNRKGNHLLKSAREQASKRASDHGRVTYVRNFQQKPTGFTVGAVHRSSYLDLEIGTITRECARRKQKKKQWKAESGEREREREERGETRMHFCLHLPVTSEGTSCLSLFSPGGHYYCFKLPARFFTFPFPFNLSRGLSLFVSTKDSIPESEHERLWQNAMRKKDIYTISVHSYIFFIQVAVGSVKNINIKNKNIN